MCAFTVEEMPEMPLAYDPFAMEFRRDPYPRPYGATISRPGK
jgi:hypothetical protein